MKVFICFIASSFILSSSFAQEKDWETRLELAYVKTGGNTETGTMSSKLDVKSEGWGNRYAFLCSFLRTEDEGKEKANNFASELRVERVVSGRLFVFLGINYFRDRFAGYEYRYSIGPGLGYDISKKEKHVLKGLCSIRYYREKSTVEGDSAQMFAWLKSAINDEWKIRMNVTWKNRLEYNVSMKDSRKYYIDFESALEVAISSKLSIGMSYLVKYQNIIPRPEIETTDTAFMSSLIINL